MVGFSKKRKSSKLRGTREHGRGKKKGRGAGLRGGRGNAGRHKHKRVHYAKLEQEWGSLNPANRGFKRPEEAIQVKTTINVSDLDAWIAAWVSAGKAQKVGGGYTVDLSAIGYDKLLGNGQVRNAYKITVSEATPSATTKVEEAGGQVVAPAA